MISCRACNKRFLQAAYADISAPSVSQSYNRKKIITPSFSRTWHRYASTEATTPESETPMSSRQMMYMQRTREKINSKRLQKEVVWLKDPAKLASNTLNLLEHGQRDKALDIVRVACKNGTYTVSWNHVINDDMRKGRVSLAVQTYQEMKKRAQPPDAYTYTILLRGLAAHVNHASSLQRAITIYHSMFAENSPVRPSTIHTNAVLNVCARAGDLDALFGIAAKLPVSGPGAPDNYTFTTILNCIRTLAWTGGKDLPHETHSEKLERKRRAVAQGTRMWSEVIDRWKRGKLQPDEELVCAMGRLLLLGNSYADCDNVLSLVEQTMSLPREIPRIGDAARKTHYRHPRAELDPASPTKGKEDASNSQTAIALSEASREEGLEEESQSQDVAMVFAPVTKASASRFPVVPGQNTLSLLVEACTRMNAIKPAQAYWAKITAKIEPDLENYHTYLRLLRLSRSSGLVVELLQELATPKSQGGLGLKPMAKTFRIGMSACSRDGNNQFVLSNGTRILELMQKHTEDPDIRTGEMFLEILDAKTGPWPLEKVSRAMEAVEAFWLNARGVATYGSWSPRGADTRDDFEPDTAAGFAPGDARTRAVDNEYWRELGSFAGLYSKQIARFVDKYRDQLSKDQAQTWRGRTFRKMLHSQYPTRKPREQTPPSPKRLADS